MTSRLARVILIVSLCFPYASSFAQTQADFEAAYTEVYMQGADTAKALQLTEAAVALLDDNEELQTYSNYFIIGNIYRTLFGEEETATEYEKKANEQLQFNKEVQKPDSYDTPVMEWLYEYQMEFAKKRDPAFGKEALRFLQKHDTLQTFNNYSSIANYFETIGDFSRAEELYTIAYQLVEEGKREEPVILFNYFYFLMKMGQFQQAERLMDLNNELGSQADSLYRVTYRIYDKTMSTFYALSIGDYAAYIRDSNELYDIMGATMPADLGYDPYEQSRKINEGLGFESIRMWKEARKGWADADEAQRKMHRALTAQYPNYPTYYMPYLSLFDAKRGELNDYATAIAESDTYYEKYEQLYPLTYALKSAKAQRYGFLRDHRYRSLYEGVLQQLEETRDFSLATRPMADYAYFLMRDGDYQESLKAYRDLYRQNIKWLNDMILTFGEKAFVAYYNTKLRDGYDNFHSFVRKAQLQEQSYSPDLANQAFDNTLLTKSIALRGARKKRQAFLRSSSPEVADLYSQWLEKKEELIRLYQMTQSDQGVAQSLNATATENPLATTLSTDTLEALQTEIDQLENRLATLARDFKKTVTVDEPSWKDVRSQLKEGEAAVEVVRFTWRDQAYLSDEAYYAAYLLKWNADHVEVIYFSEDAAALDERFYDYYRNAIQYQLEDEQSYERYWQPLKPHLQDVDKLYFAPDGIFHLINLPTLRNPETGKFLLDEMEIQYFTSTQDLIQKGDEADLRQSVLIGRPSYEISDYQPTVAAGGMRSFVRNFRNAEISDLPGTEVEVVAIEQALQKQRVAVDTYLGGAATEDVLHELSSPDILHVATHGYWSPVEGRTSSAFRSFNALVNSGLLLSGVVNYYQADVLGASHDGILTAYEAQQLDLESTDMVILSACETGLGAFDAGEGVYGLQRAFQAAGAASVITSLWKVDDEATKDFMIAFYEKYIESTDKLEAFRHAQMTTRRQYAHPYYWGAFVLVGR